MRTKWNYRRQIVAPRLAYVKEFISPYRLIHSLAFSFDSRRAQRSAPHRQVHNLFNYLLSLVF